jgi:adenosylcobinamide-phosphate synthase
VVTVLLLGAVSLTFGMLIAAIPGGSVLEVVLAAVLLAQKSLVDHVRAVVDGIRISLDDGRRTVSMIVGRDTSKLDEAAVSRAAIESAAENLSDGVVAPAFWFLVGGVSGILLYKIINTADSMIGHKTECHAEFGWAAARLDDVLNWIPARLTVVLIALGRLDMAALRVAARDGPLHRSVNAGWPEAAMASTLGLALSGPRSYGGTMTTDPILNADGRRDATAVTSRRRRCPVAGLGGGIPDRRPDRADLRLARSGSLATVRADGLGQGQERGQPAMKKQLFAGLVAAALSAARRRRSNAAVISASSCRT